MIDDRLTHVYGSVDHRRVLLFHPALMDYTPRHAQPFTYAQARELEIPEVTKGHALQMSARNAK